MNVTVLGLWHLGCVTAACCARHFQVVGLDFDAANIARLNSGQAPLSEPGLNELLAAGLASKKLSFTTEAKTASANADVLWLCYDTPVNENDESDVDFVLANLRRALPHLPKGALVLISAQLPVGTCRKLEAEFPQFYFAYSPENLQLGKAIDAFEKAVRVVVGIRNDAKKPLLEKLFVPFTPQILFMRTESAEMVKHALNSFLALSITFIAVALCLAGVLSALRMPSSVFPQTDFPRVVILLNNGIMPADEMMATVTRPIEEAMKDIPGAITVRSATKRGSAQINVFFNWHVDMSQSELYVLGRLSQIRSDLPTTAATEVERVTFSAFPIIGVSLTSSNRDIMSLWETANYELKPRFLQIPGVARVEITGGRTPEYHVVVDPLKLQAAGLGYSLLAQ